MTLLLLLRNAAVTTVSPSGLAHTRTQGSPVVSPQLRPSGLVHTRAQGSPTVKPTLVPSGLTHTRAQGSPVVKPTIVPSGQAHTRAQGSITVSTVGGPVGVGLGTQIVRGSRGITPRRIRYRPQAFIRKGFVVPRVTVSPASISHTRAIGSPTVTAGFLVSPASLTHTRAQGSPTVNPALSPSGQSHTRALGSPTVSVVVGVAVSARVIQGGRGIRPRRARHRQQAFIRKGTFVAAPAGVQPASLTHTRAQGSPTVSPQLGPSSITHTRAQGDISVGELVAVPLSARFIRSQARGYLAIRRRRRTQPWASSGARVYGPAQVNPASISHSRAQGSPTVSRLAIRQIGNGLVVTVAWIPRPTGLEHTRAQGSIVVLGRHIAPDGLSHTRAQGTPQLSARVIVTGLSRTRAQGSPSVNPRTASPASIAHTRAQGSHTVTLVKIQRPDGLVHTTRAQGTITVRGRLEVGPPSLVRIRTQGTPILSGRVLPLSTVHLRVQGSPSVNVRTLAPLAISRV